MKLKNKKIRQLFDQLKEIFVFLLALGIFLYSGYKIARHTGILKTEIFGAECGSCFSCDACGWCNDFCKELKDWCWRICPRPSPTPTVVISTSTPTPTPPTPTEVPPTETPTPTQPQGPTLTLTPGPTSVPTGGGGPTAATGKRPEHNTCYYQCDSDYDCHLGQDCQDIGGGAKICRNPNCVSETDCECPGGAGGAILGTEATPTPKYGEILGLAYTGQSLALHLEGAASIIGKIMVILGAFLLL